MTPVNQSDIVNSRPERVGQARRLIREAAGYLSAQINDEQIIGGALSGISTAENHCREALANLAGLDVAQDVRVSQER